MTKTVKSFSLLSLLMAGILLGFYTFFNNVESSKSPINTTNTVNSGTPLFNTGHASYPSYDLNSIVGTSDVIIIGEVIKVNEVEQININAELSRESRIINRPYITSDVKVVKVIKGQVNIDDIIKIKQRAGQVEEEYFLKGQKSMFFLQSYPYNIPYSTLNPFQGHIKLVNGKTQLHKDNQLFKDGINEDELTNTVEQIIKNKK